MPSPTRARLVVPWLALWVAACGPSDVGRTTGGPLQPSEPAPAPAPTPRPAGRPYADTPLSAYAEAMTDLSLDAIRGRPLPEPPVPFASPALAPVAWDAGVDRPGPDELHVLGFAFEMELVFKHGERRPEATGPERWGSVHAVIGVTRHGLRLVELRPRRIRPEDDVPSPPPHMAGVSEIGATLMRDLRRGDVSAWELGEDDRRLLGNDAVWAQVREDRPRTGPLRELAEALSDLPAEPLETILGDQAVLVATPDDRLLSLASELTDDGGAWRLRVEPLVRVGQVWPPNAESRRRASDYFDD